MLIKVSASNFKSFNQEVSLSMISSSKIQKQENHVVIKNGTKILKHAAIYGANASGKTNLIDILDIIKETVEDGLPQNCTEKFCKILEVNKENQSKFEVQFMKDNRFFAYGFSAILSKRQITSEWLYELHSHSQAKCIFETDQNGKPILGNNFAASSYDKNKFKIYAENFDGSANTLFLTEMNHNKKYDTSSALKVLQDVFNWFIKDLNIIYPDDLLANFSSYSQEKSLSAINKLISSFDTGISKMQIQNLTVEDLQNELSPSIYNMMLDSLKKRAKANPNHTVGSTVRSKTSFFNIELDKNSVPKISTLKMKHGKSFFDFEFRDESDGTRRLFDFLDMLLSQNSNAVYVVDEIDRSLHPKLTYHFLELFSSIHSKQSTQLIFTTHESSIMNQNLLRRDEIWFVERKKDNSSIIYSLDQFKERYDFQLSKAYLEGRYGAIPIFSDLKFEGDED